MTSIAKCGQRGCPNPHPARPWVERPQGALARRLAARQPAPETPGSGPAWLRRLTAKEMAL